MEANLYAERKQTKILNIMSPGLIFILVGVIILVGSVAIYILNTPSDKDATGYAIIVGYDRRIDENRHRVYFPEYEIRIGDETKYVRSGSGSTSIVGEVGDTVTVWKKHFIVDRYITEHDFKTLKVIVVISTFISILSIVIGVAIEIVMHKNKRKQGESEYGEYRET